MDPAMLSRAEAEVLIHRLARSPGAIVLELPHAQIRMIARGISDRKSVGRERV